MSAPDLGGFAAEVQSAARANAQWCDAVCRGHGLVGVFAAEAWTCVQRTPRRYPDAVTLAAHTGVAELLARVDASAGCSVKDSFARLDLRAAGFAVVFDAEWIWRPAALPVARPGPGIGWSVVTGAAGFTDWTAAWSADDGGASPLRDGLLADSRVEMFAGREGPRIVAGAAAILSRTAASGTVVSISNVFGPGGRRDEVLAGLVAAVTDRHPGLPICGYERGAELESAAGHGFARIGPLRVWSAG